MSARRRVGLVITAVAIAAVARATLVSRTATASAAPAWCLLCDPYAGIDMLLNVPLFIPLGLGLRLAGLSRRTAFVATVSATVAIELLQFIFVAGRVASWGDVASNSVGGALGVLAADHWRTLLLPAPARARHLTLAAALGWLAVLVATAWLVAPAARLAPLRLRTAPADRGARFGGMVLAASVDGVPAPSSGADGRVPRPRRGRDDIRAEAIIVPGAATPRDVPIVDGVDGLGRSIVALGQDAYDATFTVRRNATTLRLRTPSISVREALPRPSGDPRTADTVRLDGWTERYRMYLSARSRQAWNARMLELRPTLGWALIIPFEYTLWPVSRRFTAIWLGLLVVPAGYWGARGARRDDRHGRPRERRRGLPVGLATPTTVAAGVAVGLVALPLSLGLPPGYPWEWAGSAAGAALGWVAGIASR